STFTANKLPSPTDTPYIVTARTDGATVPASFSLTNTTTASNLAFIQQPTNGIANSTISPAVTVQLVDRFSNKIATAGVEVSMTLGNARGATLGGTLTQKTDASGLATFNNLTIDKGGVGYTLLVSAAGLTGATSAAFGQASRLVFIQQPTNGPAGKVISPPVEVTADDGNLGVVSGISVTMARASGTGNLSGTLTQTTNGSGLASFSDLSLDAVGAYVLSAKAGPLSITSTSFNQTGAATQIAFQTTGQPASGAAGSPLTTSSGGPITVQVVDANNKGVPGQ